MSKEDIHHILERIELSKKSCLEISNNLNFLTSGNLPHRKASIDALAKYTKNILVEIEDFLKIDLEVE